MTANLFVIANVKRLHEPTVILEYYRLFPNILGPFAT